MKKVTGTFEIKTAPAAADKNIQEMGGMAMTFEKVFSGALMAHSHVSMFGVMNKAIGSGGYVALELVTGKVEEKQGTFILQHSCFMNKGQQEQLIKIVPDSGTGELTGLSGNMEINIVEGQHYYSFEYSFNA